MGPHRPDGAPGGIRAAHRPHHVPVRDAEEPAPADGPTADPALLDRPAPDAFGVLEDRDEARRLLAGLTPHQRAAVVLRYLADQPDDEIAAALGCTAATVRSHLSHARSALRLAAAGRTARDGTRHHEMALTAVRTLAGPPVPDGSVVWVETPELPPLSGDRFARGNPGPLWGPGGALFGIVFPQEVVRSPLGATIYQAPVVDDRVVFGDSGGCWPVAGLAGTPYHGPLTQLPGSSTYERAAAHGFTAVPLSTVESVMKSAEDPIESSAPTTVPTD